MDWGGSINELPLSTPVKRVDNSKASVPCYYALSPHIYQDGKVGLCACAGADDSLIIGNINSQSWIDILLSFKRISLIFSFIDGSVPNYCRKCSFYNSASNHSNVADIDWKKFKSKFLHLNKQTEVLSNLKLKKLPISITEYRETLFEQYLSRANGILHLGAQLTARSTKICS
jgi:hypothetical protein